MRRTVPAIAYAQPVKIVNSDWNVSFRLLHAAMVVLAGGGMMIVLRAGFKPVWKDETGRETRPFLWEYFGRLA
jgi:hypothetical protein